ncbi:MAG: hypothetical protein GTO26_11720 [Planctomycetales bacterium]|nr:hypothetical protein [Planctomycetales bacterium]
MAERAKIGEGWVQNGYQPISAQGMAICDDVQIKAAHRLGIHRNTLHKKRKKYWLEKSGAWPAALRRWSPPIISWSRSTASRFSRVRNTTWHYDRT